MRLAPFRLALVACCALAAGSAPARPEDGINPFTEPETAKTAPAKTVGAPPSSDRPYLAPMDGSPAAGSRYAPPLSQSGANAQDLPDDGPPAGGIDEKGLSVERGDLEPVMAADGSGLPYELWRGLSVADIEAHIAALEIPPRSPALYALWRRLISTGVGPGSESEGNVHFTRLRVEALDRSGLVDVAVDVLAKEPASTSDPILSTLVARSEIGLGNRDRGCEIARGFSQLKADMPQRLKGEAVLIAGYCAALAGDMEAAGLKAGLARELGLEADAGPDALDAIASGATPAIASNAKLSLLDYRILEIKGGFDQTSIIARATPGLLAALALAPQTETGLKLAAAEAGAAINVIAPVDLAAVYRSADGGETGPALVRAALFKAAENERTPLKKARAIRAFLDEARRAGLYWPALDLMARPAQTLKPVVEIGWFAETAVETNLAVGNYDGARAWAAFGSSIDQPGATAGLAHWIALADIADPSLGGGRSANLGPLEQMAQRGRLDPTLLHRLATVLDALDFNVPIPLWDLASRTPQPSSGHLPETGILSELTDASKKKEFGRTVLLAMRTLGPNGAEGAHMIALGDAIRGLKRAGLDADARRLAFEGLFTSWPRTVSN